MKENYDKIFENTVKSFSGVKKKLLLHACCAPCSSSVLERVTPFFYVTLFFYNPNITDENEYNLRLNELRRFVSSVYGDQVKILDGEFEKEKFLSLAKGKEDLLEGGARCKDCYRLRLERTAQVSKKEGFDFFTTTLSVSPYKNAEYLNLIGGELSKEYQTPYLFSDFKKKQGYVRSIELSKEYGLYRQNYCGCEFSKRFKEKDGD